MGRIVLVTGGARSGKSRFAENYAIKRGNRVAYIATAGVYDEEMAYRVRLHRERRPASWQTFEAAYDAHKTIDHISERGEHDFILFDCLTLYISNILCAAEDIADSDKNYRMVRGQIDKLLTAMERFTGSVLLVTNEVGAGIVPDNRLSREYRDLAGIANQLVAAQADEVYLVVCGLGVDIRRLAAQI